MLLQIRLASDDRSRRCCRSKQYYKARAGLWLDQDVRSPGTLNMGLKWSHNIATSRSTCATAIIVIGAHMRNLIMRISRQNRKRTLLHQQHRIYYTGKIANCRLYIIFLCRRLINQTGLHRAANYMRTCCPRYDGLPLLSYNKSKWRIHHLTST